MHLLAFINDYLRTSLYKKARARFYADTRLRKGNRYAYLEYSRDVKEVGNGADYLQKKI